LDFAGDGSVVNDLHRLQFSERRIELIDLACQSEIRGRRRKSDGLGQRGGRLVDGGVVIELVEAGGVRCGGGDDLALAVVQLDRATRDRLLALIHDAVIVGVQKNEAADGRTAWYGTVFESFDMERGLASRRPAMVFQRETTR